MKFYLFHLTFFLINIFFVPVIKAQDSYILRGNAANAANTPPPPPSIKPKGLDDRKKTITTKNPSVEAAKPSPKSPSPRDSNPNVGDINASTSAPKTPKNVEVKPKSEKPAVAIAPQNTPKPSVATPNNPKPANTPTATNTSTPKPAPTNTNAPKTPTATNTSTPKPAPTNTNAPKTPTATNTSTPKPATATTTPTNIPKNTGNVGNTTLPNSPKNTTSPVTSPPKTAPEPAPVEVSVEVATKNAKLLRVAADTAKAYIGTVYLAGGMTRAGVDCSGLVNLAYKNTGIKIPRTSRDLSEFGTEVKDVTDIKIGDLLFFDSNDSKRINHVAIVTRITPEQIFFIHATVSKGVREDKLLAGYWTSRHRKTMRILPN